MWQGVCIYNEVAHNKNAPVLQRQEYLCDIEEINPIEECTYLIKIKIPKVLSKDLCSPGAYILIKSKDKDSEMFNTPISVMDVDVDNNTVEVVVKTIGIKTKDLIKSNQVYIKAPYFNGIFGLKEIKSTSKSNSLVILNGILSTVNAVHFSNLHVERDNLFNVCFGFLFKSIIYGE